MSERGKSNKGRTGKTGAGRTGGAKRTGGPKRGAPSGDGPGRGGLRKGGGSEELQDRSGDKSSGRPQSPRRRGVGGRPAGRPSGGRGRDGAPSRRATKRGLGGDQVEGRQAVRELLLAQKRPVSEILMIEDMDDAEILTDIRELAADLKVPLKAVTRKRFDADALTMSHQGVLAKAKPLKEFSLTELLQRPDPFLLMLDGVTDPQNLGAILRTAECAGVTGVLLPRHRAAHVTPTVTKTAAGAIEHLPMAIVGGVPAALTELQKAGALTVGLDADGEASLFDLELGPGRPVVLVLGAEGSGLSALTRKRVDVVASLPLLGHLNSLNVAMASSAACFEVVRQRRGPASPVPPQVA